jgi:predicted nucleic acid-binding Zn ribbon protein
MFEPYRSFQRYCSDRCRVKVEKRRPSRYKKKPTVRRECKQCGATFETNDDKRHYCSNACYALHEAHRRKESEVRRCMNPACDKEFTTTHWAKRYCSEECRKEAKKT